jgi:Cu/Ag efflux pump CusA
MTGAKSDIAVKIFGEDMDSLYSLAEERLQGLQMFPELRM